MQILFPGQSERLYTEFKDSNYNLVDPSGSVTVDIQGFNGNYVLQDGVGVRQSLGIYYYDYDTSGATFGYYGAWWKGTIDGTAITQDLPNPFKIESPREAVRKGVYLDRVRSKLYMHLDSGGFVNKFPRNREILDLMQNSLDWINAHPPHLTSFDYITLPDSFIYLLEMGTVILALQALGIFEAGKHFVYNDNGLSLTRDRSAKYMALYGAILQQYAKNLKDTKTIYSLNSVNMKGMFSSTTGYPRSLSRALRGTSKFS